MTKRNFEVCDKCANPVSEVQLINNLKLCGVCAYKEKGSEEVKE